jgi:hypothetical protein
MHVVDDRARRPESTILALNNTLYHWGAIVLPLGYTVHEVFNGGGNPYGASYTSDHRVEGPDEEMLMLARAQGARLARVAGVIGAAVPQPEHVRSRAGSGRVHRRRAESAAAPRWSVPSLPRRQAHAV